jgi:hypothetical protein
MIQNVVPGKHEEVQPDVLIPYSIAADRERLADSSICVISVRPETNKVNYEAIIVQSILPYGEVVYLASLNGNLINKMAIIACHYSSQLQFAITGKEEMNKYPEMIEAFEEKFKVNFEGANIIGSFQALLDFKVKNDAEELFATMVPESDFLNMYGQTIKKIDDYYILNYDIPAIITRHHEKTAMFIIAFRFNDPSLRFSDLHHLIYENMCRNENTEILGPEERHNLHLEWYDRVRRTYHISRSHIEAMFDLTDYVFKDEKERIPFSATPLGQMLIKRGILSAEQLEERMSYLKNNPLVYLQQENGSRKLVDIILEGKIKSGAAFIEQDLEECTRIIDRIDWNNSD